MRFQPRTTTDAEALLRGAEYLVSNFSNCASEDNTIKKMNEQLESISACFEGIYDFVSAFVESTVLSDEISERFCSLGDNVLFCLNSGKDTDKSMTDFINVFYYEIKKAING